MTNSPARGEISFPTSFSNGRRKRRSHRISSPDIGEIEVSLATGRGGNHNASAFLIAKGGQAFLQAVEPVRDISELGGIAESFLAPQHSLA